MVTPAEKTILVVDDEDTICEFFQFLLGREGFNIMIAHSGKGAIEKLKFNFSNAKRINLIVLDLMMPNQGGYEVLQELQNTEYGNIPIMIATAKALDSGAISLLKMESNVHSFWSKPLDQDKFIQEVHAALGTTRFSKG